MKRNNNTNIDELLSCYIDDELTQREGTEIKRLIRNDQSIGEKLSQMQKQKELLNSLPMETAPVGLLDNVKAMLTKEFVEEFIKGPQVKVPKRTKVVVEKPKEVIEKPVEKIAQPKPVVEQPKEKVEPPQPVVQKPKEIIEPPKTVIKQPEKIITQPQPVPDQEQKNIDVTKKPAEPPKRSVAQVAASKAYAQQADQYAEYTDKTSGARNLLYRRMLTAAVFAIFLGSFGWVIFSIMSPPAQIKPDMAAKPKIETAAPAKNPLPQVAKVVEKTPADLSPFNASLKLTTRKSIEVNYYLQRAIFSHGLLDYTIPKRQADQTTYNINCSPETIVALVTDISKVWDKLDSASMNVFAGSTDSTATIDGVTADQAAALLRETDHSKRLDSAKNFALANAIAKSLGSQNATASAGNEKISPTETPKAVEPILTKPQQPTNPQNTDPTQKATLTITVIGL